MTAEEAPADRDTRAALLAVLRESRDQTLRALAAVDAEALEAGRYENGWNGREILAHLAAIEWTYPRLIDLARTARAQEGEAGRADGAARGGMDAYNARQVAKRAGVPVAELIAEWQRNREALIAAVEAAEADLFAAPLRSAGGRSGTLATVLEEIAAGHVAGHLADLLGPAR